MRRWRWVWRVPRKARIALVAIGANIAHRLGGIDGAITLLRERSGLGLVTTLLLTLREICVNAPASDRFGVENFAGEVSGRLGVHTC